MSVQIMRMHHVTAKIELSRATIYRLTKAGKFPAPKRLSPNAIGWLESDIDHWIKNCGEVSA